MQRLYSYKDIYEVRKEALNAAVKIEYTNAYRRVITEQLRQRRLTGDLEDLQELHDWLSENEKSPYLTGAIWLTISTKYTFAECSQQIVDDFISAIYRLEKSKQVTWIDKIYFFAIEFGTKNQHLHAHIYAKVRPIKRKNALAYFDTQKGKFSTFIGCKNAVQIIHHAKRIDKQYHTRKKYVTKPEKQEFNNPLRKKFSIDSIYECHEITDEDVMEDPSQEPSTDSPGRRISGVKSPV